MDQIEKHPLNYVPDSVWEMLSMNKENSEKYLETLNSISKDELLEFLWTLEALIAEFKYEPFCDFMDEKLSEDGISDLASYVVEQGKAYALSVFDNPSSIPPRVDHPLGTQSKAVRMYYKRFGGPIPFNPN